MAVIKLDATDVRRLAADLGKVPAKVLPVVDAISKKGADNVKTDWQQRWSGLRHARDLPNAITYDRSYGFGKVGYEVGPDKDKRQGALGNIIEFGTVKNAPIPGGLPAAQTEAPKYERELGAAMINLLGR